MDERERTIKLIWDTHKRGHGLTPNSPNWDDPRWLTEWAFDASLILDALIEDGWTRMSNQDAMAIRGLTDDQWETLRGM